MALDRKSTARRWTATGHLDLDFEVQFAPEQMGAIHDEDRAEEFIEECIEGDPMEFFARAPDGVTVTDLSYRVSIDACDEQQPDWGHQLATLIVNKERRAIEAALAKLSDSAKRKLVAELSRDSDREA